MIKYKEVLSIAIDHSYYADGQAEDFQFVFSHATKQLFRKGRLVPKVRDGKLTLFAETREDALTLGLDDRRITVGLVLTNRHFYNFTQKPAQEGTQLYHNDSSLTSLLSGVPTRVVGRRFEHKISKTKRKVTLELTAGGELVESLEVLDGNVESINYLIKNPGLERFEITEKYTDEDVVHRYFLAEEFTGVFVDRLVTLRLDDTFLTTKPEFTIAFTAVQELLHYYIVARNYGSEFNQLAVTGLDKSGAGAPVPINFSKVTPSNFTSQHLTKEVLGVSDDHKLVLFHSAAPLARRDVPNMDIQLSINGETLIPTLPLTGPERAKADFIVHLSKPKT